jgi:cytochrome P450 family 110
VFRTFAADALTGVLGDGSLLVAYGEPHKRARKLLQPPFHGARMRAYGRAMQDVALEYTSGLSAGTELRAHDVTTSISLDVILRTVFGVSGSALAEGRRIMKHVLSDFSPLVLFSKQMQTPLFPPWKRYLEARAAYDALLRDILRDRRAKGSGEDILGMMLEARWDDGTSMSDAEIGDQLLTLLVAGHETTAISLAWAVHDVYRRPDVLARLRGEIAPLGSEPDPEALARLPYLSAVCDESLRFRPIVTDTVRTLLSPLEYGDTVVPAGTGLCIAIELIHKDPVIYPDPDEFFPARFLEKKPGPFEFLPFGGGSRRCIGAAFSDYEARVVLGTLVATVDLTVLGEDERVRRNITMGPKRGVPVRVIGKV